MTDVKDYRLNLAKALFEASYGMDLMIRSDETRDYWLARADAALRTPRQLDAEAVARVQEKIAHGEECPVESGGLVYVTLRLSDVKAMLAALT